MSSDNEKLYLQRFEMRLSRTLKEQYEQAAEVDNAMFRGKPSVATWIKQLANERIEQLKKEGKI
ncbi:hypothetical protein [Vibrio quintilis]|nr:hypothetical protein [Vibrio quintilis]